MTADSTPRWHADEPAAPLAGSCSPDLAERVRAQTAAQLAAEANAAEQTGRGRLTAPQRAGLCRQVIRDVLDGEAARALAAGTPPLDATTEEHLEQVVFDALFGLGGFQPYLDEPLRRERQRQRLRPGVRPLRRRPAGAGCRRSRPATRSWSDLVRAVAARAGIEERRFDRGCPGCRCRCPAGGACSR